MTPTTVEDALREIEERAQAAWEYALGRIAQPCHESTAARYDTYRLGAALKYAVSAMRNSYEAHIIDSGERFGLSKSLHDAEARILALLKGGG